MENLIKGSSDLRKQVKHVATLCNPLQAQVGKLDDHMARSQLRLAKLEAITLTDNDGHAESKQAAKATSPRVSDAGKTETPSTGAEKETKKVEGQASVLTARDNFEIVDQVANILGTNVEPLTMRIHALETFLLPLTVRISDMEEIAYQKELEEEEDKNPGSGVSAQKLFSARMSTMENLIGPLHERLMSHENIINSTKRQGEKAKRREVDDNQHRAKMEQLENHLTELRTLVAETKTTATKAQAAALKAGKTAAAAAAAGTSGHSRPSQGDDTTGNVESLQSKLVQDAEWFKIQEQLDLEVAALKDSIKKAREEIIEEVDFKLLTTAAIHKNTDKEGVTVINIDSTVNVKPQDSIQATNNGRGWALEKWNHFIQAQCDLHNAPWDSLSKQLGIFDTLMVFRENNLNEDHGLDTTLLESQFIDHLERCLQAKADITIVSHLEGSFGLIEKEISKLKDKLDNNSMDGKVLDQLEDRVADMIRAAAPVESDIIDRIQLLFENKMVNRDDIEDIVSSRVSAMEDSMGEVMLKPHGQEMHREGRGSKVGSNSPGLNSSGYGQQQQRGPGRDNSPNRARQREQITNSVKDMQSLSSKADRRELLHAIESVEKQVPGAQDRLATALAARAHCYQTLRCLSCDQTTSPPATAGVGQGVPSALIPKAGKRAERMVNVQSLAEQQDRSQLQAGSSPNARNSKFGATGPLPGVSASPGKSPTSFLHLMPRSHTAGGTGIVGVNTPRAIAMAKAGLEMMPSSDGGSPMPDELLDMNMNLGFHVRSLPQLAPEKQWSPEVARELRKGFNC